MSKTIERLRAASQEYRMAYQARYNELMGDWSGRRDTQECFDAHDRVVKQIELEELVPTWPAGEMIPTSCDIFITDAGTLVDRKMIPVQFNGGRHV